MHIRFHVVLASLIGATALTAQAQTPAAAPPPSPTVAPSSFASTEVRFSGRYVYGRWNAGVTAVEGPARVTIRYGQPHARGRQIVGQVVPLDSVWRLGANTATELRTDVDLMLGGVRIPHGVYSLWALPSVKGWELIVNREVGQFGTSPDYTPSMDLARIPLRVRTTTDPVESLSIYLIPDAVVRGQPATTPRGTLKIMWGTVELSLDWSLAEWTKPGSTSAK